MNNKSSVHVIAPGVNTSRGTDVFASKKKTISGFLDEPTKMDKKIILQLGSSINIKRTDGRVHSALVSQIHYDSRRVSVEWFEQNETKGKEIDMVDIESLNPDIVIIENEEEVKFIEPPPRMTEIQRESSGSSEEETSAAMARSGRFSHKLDESDDDFNSNQFSTETTTLSNPTRQSLISFKGNNGVLKSPQIRYTESTNKNTTSQQLLQQQQQQLQLQQQQQQQQKDKEQQNENTIGSSSRQQPQVTRRGNVVKEVEKLKKNREERRQRQAEERAEKEAFLQLAPGNPHWELLNMILEYRRGLDIKPLNESDIVEDHLITVCVRKRPLNKKESMKKEVDVITIPSKNQLIVHEPKIKVDLTKYLENQLFRFDYAFDETCTNAIVYKYTAQPLIKTIFEGGFATCFAYGQTGSGKTHTMGGDFNGKLQDCQKGIYAMAANDVFNLVKSPKYRSLNLVVSSSFFEIYSGKVFDLLNNKNKLRILEDAKQQVQVVGLTEKVVYSVDEVLKLISKGNQARTSGQTFANSNSSRSHAVFQIFLRSNNNMHKVHGKFSFIDLAGNERGADTSSANRQTRMEGAEINKSLLALKECIRALGRRGAHLPFRVSKLTQVLRDSFVGANSRTCMIAMVSPGVNSCEHTLNTLRYANRVKELGAGDLPTNTLSDEQQEEDGDLLQLRSLNENDMSQEMLDFHQVISELQAAEENMLDNHKQLIDEHAGIFSKFQKLLKMTENVTYDQEAYCEQSDELLIKLIALSTRAQEAVSDFRTKLSDEEQLSRKTERK